MAEILLEIPDGTAEALRVAPRGLAAELQLAAAVKLFEVGRLSGGAAAALAGMPKPLFMQKLGDYGVAAIRHEVGELREDFNNA